MAADISRFTLLVFPQSVDATGKLALNLVFLPRNINPLDDVREGGASIAPPFVSVQPQFTIKVVNNPIEFPGRQPAPPDEEVRATAPLTYSAQMTKIYDTLKNAKKDDGVHAKYFDIDEDRSADRDTTGEHVVKPPLPRSLALRKYLPLSYRACFNFTSPRIPNAVTDDSYHCAMRDDKADPTFKVGDGKVSWGKVYAHLMRQPQIAEAAGLIYRTAVQLNPGDFKQGGWIYADILAGDYSAQQAKSEAPKLAPFIKKYAARIPPLVAGKERRLFAAVLFPVVKSGESPVGLYDELYIEAARYAEGFAGLTHSYQPQSQNLLVEKADGFHPQKEMGIRLGWDDEQLLIWYLRQLAEDEKPGTRLDAPLGVTGFGIDVRLANEQDWESLTAVVSQGPLKLEDITFKKYGGELPYQVYPTKIAGNYWLPMYFASWNDQSMVLPDERAAELYANDQETKKPVTLNRSYKALAYKTKLRYGNQYEFRIRMRDMSGGGPEADTEPEQKIPGMRTTTPFKRHIAPGCLLFRHDETELKANTDDANFSSDHLRVQRPLLGYPAVLFTGRYKEDDALTRLRQNRDENFANQEKRLNDLPSQKVDGFGIPDLDVVKVEIRVEAETLKMDNLLSDDGREHYVTLYRTFRSFDAADPDHQLDIPITWKDQKILNLGDTTAPFDNAADNKTVARTAGTIVLPTARNIRLTVRACCEGTEKYWGNYSDTDASLDARRGKPTTLSLRRESAVETGLFSGLEDPQFIQGLYLQPDPLRPRLNPLVFKTLNGNEGNENRMPDIVQRLAKQIDVEAKGMTLTARNGERLVFWCSNLVRHTMAPDSSSITFSGSTELENHWLVCSTLFLERDWTWDSLDSLSIIVDRRHKQGRDAGTLDAMSLQRLGSLDIQRIASYQAIQQGADGNVNRQYTRIVLIDVIDGKPRRDQFPDTSEVKYLLTPCFHKDHAPVADVPQETPVLLLPATVAPVQTPKLIGAGIALSPYVRNERYSATEARTRYLWLEFDRAPDDGNDDLFARVLASAPDQLISNNDPALLELPEESPLAIDPEYVRVVTPASGHEHAGLNAMQKMAKSQEQDRNFYLLPLPPGLHHESAELYGLFTYEFRFGHSDRLWSTAQGRFGRPLRVAGLQHPAPALLAMVSRDEKEVRVAAPFARAAFGGRNVTSDPPRTSIWCLLYAQVMQADGLDHRNILLGEIRLERKSPLRHERAFREKIAKAGSDQVLVKQLQQHLMQTLAVEKEAIWQGYGGWDNKEIAQRLSAYGLPIDSPLSVLCVEVFGQITNIRQHINAIQDKKEELIGSIARNYGQTLARDMRVETFSKLDGPAPPDPPEIDPLNSQLGLFRILRTSPLTEVPFVCCPD